MNISIFSTTIGGGSTQLPLPQMATAAAAAEKAKQEITQKAHQIAQQEAVRQEIIKQQEAAKREAAKQTIKQETAKPAQPQKSIGPNVGTLTWSSEGNDDEKSKYFSRKLHLPTAIPGVTIGRGYDMKSRSSSQIKEDMKAAGVDDNNATKLSTAAGKSGKDADDFIKDNKDLVLTAEQQLHLFDIEYARLKKDVGRILTKKEVNIDTLDTHVQQLLVDLRYRGDFTEATRKKLLPALSDSCKLKEVMEDKELWKNVPTDRFNRRKDFVTEWHQSNQIPKQDDVIFQLGNSR